MKKSPHFLRVDSDLKSGWLSTAFTTSMALHDVTYTVTEIFDSEIFQVFGNFLDHL